MQKSAGGGAEVLYFSIRVLTHNEPDFLKVVALCCTVHAAAGINVIERRIRGGEIVSAGPVICGCRRAPAASTFEPLHSTGCHITRQGTLKQPKFACNAVRND